MKKLLFAVSLSVVFSSLTSAQTPAPGGGTPVKNERESAESAKPESAALADTSGRPEPSAAQKDAFHAFASCIALRAAGKTEEARRKAEEMLRLVANPRDYRDFYLRGLAQELLGNDNLAMPDFDKAIELNPRWGIVYYSRGVAYAAKRDHDRAIADFDRVIKGKPSNADPYISRGDAYSGKGDYVRAVADYSEAIRLEPASAPAYQNRAKAYEKIGESAKAQADREKAAELEKKERKP